MSTGRRLVAASLLALALRGGPDHARAGDPPAVPKVADGWSIALVQEAPAIRYPTAIVVAPDGTTYLGQDPMDMPGPVNAPVDSVLQIRPDGSTRVYADKLQAVMGLEWADGTLYVVHAPYLSSFRDADGDGAAETRVDLVTGLGPKVPGFNGLNDHVAAGVRLGMDGFLYVAVGDKGIPLARGRDGRTITLSTGGVIRVRPDGRDLEVVSSGERNPLSVALSARDDVFTFGNDDDSHRWPNSLTHHVVGGHYGYPYEFLAAPHRALPIVVGQDGGAGAQGVCSNDDGLPERFRGNLFFCDWGLQAVARYEVAPAGAGFRLVRRETIVEKGDLADFRPFSLAPTADGGGFYLVDWAYNGWLGVGPPTGRLFRLTYTGPGRKSRRPRPRGETMAALIDGLDHPTLAVRLEFQRRIVRSQFAADLKASGEPDPGSAGGPLAARLADRAAPATGRVHALWALDALPSAAARAAIRRATADPSPLVRAEATRSAGIRRDPAAEPDLVRGLGDPDPTVRREAAIALGRLPALARTSQAALYAHLAEPDGIVAWSIRRAVRERAAWDQGALVAALRDPARRDAALTLADGSYAPEVVRALDEVLVAATAADADPAWRARVVAALGGLYARVPAWSGHWYGPNPVAAPRPAATEPWDAPSMELVLAGVVRALGDGDVGVRRQAMVAAIQIGPKATPALRARLDPGGEADPANLLAAIRALADRRDAKAAAGLARHLADPTAPLDVRLAALDALGQLNGPTPINARLMVLYDAASPPALLARALPALGRARLLPSNDLIGFLDHASPAVRAAALGSFPGDKPLPPAVVESILLHADDPAPEVRVALATAAGSHRVVAAIPRLVGWATLDGPIRVESIRALAAMPDRRGLPAYVAALNDRDADLRRVGLAALAALRGAPLPELRARAARGEFAGPGALLVDRLLATFRPIEVWRVIGPFPRATGPIFADARGIDLARGEPGLAGRPVAWQSRRANPTTALVALDDLAPAAEGEDDDASREPATAFALAEVASDRDRAALLVVGGTGSAFVTLDDRVLANFATLAPGGETVRVDLKSGTNRLLIRTRQGVGPWSIRAELSEPIADDGAGRAIAAARPIPAVRAGLRAFALKHSGDPERGATLFAAPAAEGGLGCARCHGAGGTGLGPDLAGLAAKYDRAEIIASVLDPSSRIAVGYAGLRIARTDGTTAEGLVRADDPGGVELLLADGSIARVPVGQVAQRRSSEVSTMPEGLVDGLSPVDFADLVAYLTGLKPATRAGGSAN